MILYRRLARNHSSPFSLKGAAASNTDMWKHHCQHVAALLAPLRHHTRLQTLQDQFLLIN
jgi:hypothetical protein